MGRGTALQRLAEVLGSTPVAGVCAAVAFNLLAVSLGYYRNSYDAYTHMFFADHYRRDWLNLWERRWYGGFSVSTYPPLAHQLIAAASFLLGVEGAYVLVTVLAAVLVAYGSYRLTGVYAPGAAHWGSLIAALMPSLGLFLHSFGQLPMVLSTGMALTAATAVYDYLLWGGWARLAVAAMLTASVQHCHHLTALLFGVPLTLLLALDLALTKRVGLPALLKRLCLVASLSAAIALPPLLPYFQSLGTLTYQAVIPHGTRENIFANLVLSVVFFWAIYSFTVCLMPNAVVVALRRRRMAPLLAALLAYFVLGLGGTTPVPRLVFGRLWEVLTYDKFALWASVLYVPFLAVMVQHAGSFVARFYEGNAEAPASRRARVLMTALMLAGLASSFVVAAGAAITIGLRPREELPGWVLEDVARLLDRDADVYYITLGLNSQRMRLNMLTWAPTLDGGYNSARLNPLLAKSGVENIDAAKHFPNGLSLLKSLLSRASALGLKYVVCADSFYDPILLDYGFVVIKEYDVEPRTVRVWSLRAVGTAPLSDRREVFLPWSLVPLPNLALAFLLAAARGRLGVRGCEGG